MSNSNKPCHRCKTDTPVINIGIETNEVIFHKDCYDEMIAEVVRSARGGGEKDL